LKIKERRAIRQLLNFQFYIFNSSYPLQIVARTGKLMLRPVGRMLAEDSITAAERIGKSRMRIIETISGLEKIRKGCVLTIGNFDGVHIGHQEILTAAKKTTIQKQTELVVMTFDPHPVTILHSQKNPRVLNPLELKKYLLAEFGVDTLFIVKSNLELLRLSPADFVEKFIVKNIQPSVVVEGESFNFGYRRSGSIHTLQRLGAEKGFLVSVIGAKEVKLSTGQTAKISSTMIRNILESGRVADAAAALGRPYRLIGQVIPGFGKGKRLGFPTANITPLQQIIPADGVYAGFVQVGDSEEGVYPAKGKNPAALSIGRAQTFGSDNPRVIEAHILIDDVGDLSRKWLAMDFIKRLRSQKKFQTETELAAQIANDCQKAKFFLKGGVEKD
jgi:riboflavin kinase/FMN adenylyltransferase